MSDKDIKENGIPLLVIETWSIGQIEYLERHCKG